MRESRKRKIVCVREREREEIITHANNSIIGPDIEMLQRKEHASISNEGDGNNVRDFHRDNPSRIHVSRFFSSYN